MNLGHRFQEQELQGFFFLLDSENKGLPCNAGDAGSIPGLGRSPGGRNGNPLQYSCLGSTMDRGPGRLQSMGLQKSHTQLCN